MQTIRTRTFAAVALALSAVAVAAPTASAAVVADYRDDYNTGTNLGDPATGFGDGWSYYWNAPSDWTGTSSSNGSTGAITSVADYELLKWAGPGTSGWRPDGDTTTSNGEPGAFLNLISGGAGHPGRGTTQAGGLTPANNVDRFAIIAYTVTTPGQYAISNSVFSTLDAVGDGNTFRVFTSLAPGTPVLNTTYDGVTAQAFDVSLGTLSAGNTIYVAVGAGPADGNDNFTIDFSIDLVPEPASGLVLTLTALGAAMCRRARKSLLRQH